MINAGIIASQLSTPPSADPEIGDALGGGFYAGSISYGGKNYRIVVADVEAEIKGLYWKTTQTLTSGTESDSDGYANTLAMAVDIDAHPAAKHCVDYSGGGFSDWYMPSIDEMYLLTQTIDPIRSPAPIFQSGGSQRVGSRVSKFWASTSQSATAAKSITFVSASPVSSASTSSNLYVRPIRRFEY